MKSEGQPQIKSGLERVLLKDPTYLPTNEEVLKATDKDLEFMFEYRRAVGYEILTQEFIQALSSYIAQRLNIYKKHESSVPIIEVGAGNGRLSHFLRNELKKQFSQVSLVGTNLTHVDYDHRNTIPVFPVEEIDYREALKKYQPVIVICSWMPLGIDWTADFRNTSSVQEYILVGDTEICGREWETFGITSDKSKREEMSPFKKDGFNATHIESVSEQQLRYNNIFCAAETVSFVRQNK